MTGGVRGARARGTGTKDPPQRADVMGMARKQTNTGTDTAWTAAQEARKAAQAAPGDAAAQAAADAAWAAYVDAEERAAESRENARDSREFRAVARGYAIG